MPPTNYLRFLLSAILVSGSVAGAAQNAFGDSLAVVAEQVRDRLMEAGRTRVALTDISDPAGTLSPATLVYVEEMLLSRLVQAGGLVIVERRELDRVMEEQRRTANGTFDERSSIELGRLLAADAILIGRVFQVDKRMHLILRMLDTGTGELLGSAETFTAFPKGKEVQRAAEPQEVAGDGDRPVRLKRQGPGSERRSIVELRAMGSGIRHFGRVLPGTALEVAVRSREKDGDRLVPGAVAMGLQLQWVPHLTLPGWSRPNFDIGHIADLRNNTGFVGTPTARFGAVDLRQDRLFLLPLQEEQVFIQAITQAGATGTEVLEYDRYRMTDVRMDMASFNIPVRWYLGENHIYDNVPKLYTELGFGMDMVRVKANYEVTNTLVRLDRTDYTYSMQQTTFTDTKPPLSGVGNDLWFTHMSFGGGVELGRFSAFALGRWYLSSTFSQDGSSFDRVRGNILALPLLAGASDDRATMTDLARDGAVPFGALGLERERASDPSTGTPGGTVKGNGVDRFWDGGQLLFGVAFRFL